MFVQVIEGRTSDPEAVHRQLEEWERDLRPGAEGYLGSAGGCTAEGHCILVVRFEDRDAAIRNSRRPEQGRWWERTEAFFDGTVTFHDTDDVHVMSHGDIDGAHFVQVMEGRVSDVARAHELEDAADPLLAEHRPDLLGSITAFFDDGGFADVAYFSSEEEARRNEGREIPPEMAEPFGEWQQVMQVERYLDLPDPWLTPSGSSA